MSELADLFRDGTFAPSIGLGELTAPAGYKGWRESENVVRGKPLIGTDFLVGELQGGPRPSWAKLHPMDYPKQAWWGTGGDAPQATPQQPNVSQLMRDAPFGDQIGNLLGWQP